MIIPQDMTGSKNTGGLPDMIIPPEKGPSQMPAARGGNILTSLEIEAFLAIYRYRKISAAAEALFISQSSLSTRLQTLERELGCSLFERGKGVRRLQPTEAGAEFYGLAESYMELMQKMHSLSSRGTVS